jgi:coenzyme F420-reducing hydrogenase delta subunit
MNGNLETSLRNVVVFQCAGGPPANGATATAAEQAVPLHHATQTIRVPCSGKLQPEHLLKAFEAGADLVVVLTCSDGDCRYLEGRRRIQRRLDYVRGLLDDIGLGGARLVLVDRPPDSQVNRTWEAITALQAGLTASPLGRNGGTGG